ncbi:hypothetical protein PRNP1_015099 [Phytophthora ramorum]
MVTSRATTLRPPSRLLHEHPEMLCKIAPTLALKTASLYETNHLCLVGTTETDASSSFAGMESTIQAAHQHLVADSPRTTRRRCRDNQDDGAQLEPFKADVVKLSDHMDSFPLVPLPVIPLLSIAELEKVEHGLNELLESLMPHESDQQLARYATRQLAAVQRHLTQQRAQERVFHMLRGDLPVTLVPIGAPTLRKSSSASAAVKICPTPRSMAVSTDNQPSGLPLRPSSGSLTRAERPQSGSSKDTANLHWKSKKAAVEMARVMVQANATRKPAAVSAKSFVISAGDNSSRKRRRPRAPPKRTAEEAAQCQAQQLERERESRRQAAYQRLVARRELQAKRKQEHKKHIQEERSDDVKDGSGVKDKDPNDSDSDCESEASEVSNCSESDEANERTILALAVQIKPLTDGDARSEQSETADDVDDGESEVYKVDGEDAGSESNQEASEAPECHSSRSISLSNSGTDDQASETVRHETEGQNSSWTPSVIPGSSVDSQGTAQFPPGDNEVKQQENDAKPVTEVQANEREQNQEEAITLDLQRFIASRAAAKLEQLQAEKEARDIALPRPAFAPVAVPATPFTSEILNGEPQSLGLPSLRPDTGHYSAEGRSGESLSTTPPTLTGENDANAPIEPTSHEKQPCWIDEVRQSAVESKSNSPARGMALSLPRAPAVECKDYRSYFSNFHCILTTVFEQSRGASLNTSSSSSLYHRPVGASGEHTMRLQQKLYESWQSIMHDYATVFGPKIVAPEGMVPAAAATPWAPHYRINSTARKEVSEIVTQALQRLGGNWEDHPSGLGLKTTWNLLWTWSKPRVERQTLLAWQKVNHFQHAKALTRKDCLKKHIGKYLAAGGRLRHAFDIIPPTFLLPKEYVAFVQAFQERSERLRQSGFSEGKNIWIMKPVALSRGRGISLVNDLSQVIYGEQVVIQEYIAAPRLLDGFKFDLRLYVLVTSFNPLEAFLYDEGFVRLCTRPYEDGDLSNILVHLTNSSIQKDNQDAIAGSANPIASAMKEETGLRSHEVDGCKESSSAQIDAGGTKTTLAYLWRRLAAEGVDVDQVKRTIEEVVLKALLCGEDHIPFQVNSFDLLGYDILLDADLRPWLIEINSSPSMARDNDLDYQVKDAMMLDTLRVVDPLHFDRAKLAEVIARRQRELEDEKRRPHAHTRHPREAEELAARQLNADLTAILRGRVPRAYGEIPENIGNYKRLCPHTTIHNQLVKLKRSCLRGKSC